MTRKGEAARRNPKYENRRKVEGLYRNGADICTIAELTGLTTTTVRLYIYDYMDAEGILRTMDEKKRIHRLPPGFAEEWLDAVNRIRLASGYSELPMPGFAGRWTDAVNRIRSFCGMQELPYPEERKQGWKN